MLSRSRLEAILAGIPGLRIAVVGDFFLDKYLVTDPALAEVSVETGLEARQVVEVRTSPGAAGTVTSNLAALGVGRIYAVGVRGADGEGYSLDRGLRATGVRTDFLRVATRRFTPTYMKPMLRDAEGEVELERLDIKNRAPLPAHSETRLLEDLSGLLRGPEAVQAVVVADQVQERNCGVVTDHVRSALADLAHERADVTFVADSRVRIGEFLGVTVKPNAREALAAVGATHDGCGGEMEAAADAGRELARRMGRPAFVTVGDRGMLVCQVGSVAHVPAAKVTGPVDIVGAGDSATAGLVCALAQGATLVEAAELGCRCAGITVRKLGTTGTASPDELLRAHGGGGR